MLGEWVWPAEGVQVHPRGVGAELRVLHRRVKFFKTKLGKPFALCKGALLFETERGQMQAVAPKLEGHCCLKYLKIGTMEPGP